MNSPYFYEKLTSNNEPESISDRDSSQQEKMFMY